MVAVLLFALAVGAGGNPFLAILLVDPDEPRVLVRLRLLTQMIPRSGGDYMLVSRVMHPSIGWMSVFCMTTAGLLSNAFFGLAVMTAGIIPLCIAVGLIADWPGLVLWAQDAGTSKGWLIFFGLAMFAFSSVIQLWGWRTLLRIQNIFFWMVTASLGIVTIVTLFQSKGHFENKFNSFAEDFTNKPDAYQSTIATAAKAGVAVDPSFSFKATIPMVAVFATTAIFSYWSTFVGGELRQASTMKTARNMALGGIIPLIVVATCTAIFFKTFGSEFLRAANGGGLPAEIQVPGTTFFYLSGISVGSAAYTFVIFLLYIVFWPLITYISSLQQTRAIFAMSFDGVLPKGVTSVNRYGCPWLALLIAMLMSSVVFIYAVYDQTGFFIVLAYALLVQLIAMGLVGLRVSSHRSCARSCTGPRPRRRRLPASHSSRSPGSAPSSRVSSSGGRISTTTSSAPTPTWASCWRGRSGLPSSASSSTSSWQRSSAARASTSSWPTGRSHPSSPSPAGGLSPHRPDPRRVA